MPAVTISGCYLADVAEYEQYWKLLRQYSGRELVRDFKSGVRGAVYATKEETRTELFEYMVMVVFYNRQRLHSKLDYLSPAAFEQQLHQQVNGTFSLVN